jgi:hypothetical protein
MTLCTGSTRTVSLEDGTVTIPPAPSAYAFYFSDTVRVSPGSDVSVYVQGKNGSSLRATA